MANIMQLLSEQDARTLRMALITRADFLLQLPNPDRTRGMQELAALRNALTEDDLRIIP